MLFFCVYFEDDEERRQRKREQKAKEKKQGYEVNELKVAGIFFAFIYSLMSTELHYICIYVCNCEPEKNYTPYLDFYFSDKIKRL